MMVKVQSALTLLSSFDGKKCHCHTLQVGFTHPGPESHGAKLRSRLKHCHLIPTVFQSSHDLSALASTSMSNGFVQWLEEFK